jgi:protease-4
VVNPLTDKIALVVARGAIVDGNVKAGMIGGESTAKLLRTARYDDKVKAVVLRIDSGGGSAFASEQIAQEIRLLKAAGKPVIASMGAVAASGGYWIAAPADQIFAAPTTITGSIGIFALFHTAENAMSTLGLNVDGVGTTELAGFSSGLPLFKGLPADAEKLLQRSIENGYDEFITHVSTTRNIDKAQVDKIAQGRVWTGQTALKLGLVDKLGTLDDAIAAAAATASLKHFDVQLIEQEMTEQEKLMAQLFGSAKMLGLLPEQAVTMTPVQKLMQQLNQELQVLSQFNDPNGIYSVCFACQVQ